MSNWNIGKHKKWGVEIAGPYTKEELALSNGFNVKELSWETISYSDYLLRDVPEVFRGPIHSIAYDRGHAYGEDEVDLILSGLVDTLKPAINKFAEQVKNKALDDYLDMVEPNK